MLAGMCADTMLISTYQLVDFLVSTEVLVVAGAWVNTAYNLGSSLGTAVGGVAISQFGPLELFGAVAGLTALCSVISAIPALRRKTAAVSAQREAAADSPRPA